MTYTRQLKTALCGAMALAGVSAISTTPASAQSAYCDDYAYSEARNSGRGRVLGGAAAGAAAGAIIGGIIGNGRGAGIGAAAGAATGAAGGAASKDIRRSRVYEQAYADCMAASRTRAPTRARGGYEPWSAAWYDDCSARYRSFNRRTGYYTTYSGQKKFCN